MALGFQDLWVAGSQFMFKRDPVAGTQYPLIDVGTMDTAVPTRSVNKIQAQDGMTGRLRIIDERVTEDIESYDLTIRNFNLSNLALLFLAQPPGTFTQSAGIKDVQHKVFKDGLVKLIDSDAAKTALFGLDAISGVYKGAITTTATVTAISKANKTITTSDNKSGLVAGHSIFIHRTGLSDPKNARSYSVVSAVGSGPTTITVNETPHGDETAITGTIAIENGGTIYNQGVDWEPWRLASGFIHILSGGVITDLDTVNVVFSLAALSGQRQIQPKSVLNEARGKGLILFNRGGDADRTARDFSCVVTPKSANITVDDFSSMVLTVTVLSTPGADQPAGRLLQYYGTLPTNS